MIKAASYRNHMGVAINRKKASGFDRSRMEMPMESNQTIARQLREGQYDSQLCRLYGAEGAALQPYQERLCNLLARYQETYHQPCASLFSVSGRTELSGNHTDHQNGCVLAAGVSLDVIAAAAPNGTNLIRVKSEGYPEDLIDLSQRIPMPEETNTAAALIRGVAARFIQLGYPVSGFDAYTTSSVLKGSGLSSSAAFEVLLGNIINAFFADGAETPVSIAQIGQYAENVFFGKPCGLMDQMACSLGNVASIDFADPDNPGIRQVSLDLQKAGYALCIIDSGGDHADLTACYAAVPAEMRSIARQFGKQVLRQVPQAEFEAAIPALRKACGDRAVLRAMHFYGENARVMEQTAALEQGNILRFLSLVTESGRSSETLLQNIFDCRNPRQQPISMALALCRQLLHGEGACRIHGGGFAGTVQAFLPLDRLNAFRSGMEAVLGAGACHLLQIRSTGGKQLA